MNLLTESLWRDEAFTALLIRNNPLEISQLLTGDSTPPVYFLLLHYISLVFGDSEVALRVPSVVFLIGTVVAMYFLAEHLKRGSGWIIAALTLTQPLLFRYGFEARTYTLLAFLTSLTLLFYLKKNYRLLIPTAVILVYTHLFSLWVVGILLAWSLYHRLGWKALLIPTIAILPWIPNYANVSRLAGNFLSPPDLVDLGNKLLGLGTPVVLSLAPVLKKITTNINIVLLTLLWIVPIIGTFLFSQFRPIFLERYLIIAVPPMLLLLILAWENKLGRVLVYASLAVQVFICLTIFTAPNKADFRSLANFVTINRQVGDTVLNASGLTYFESWYYGLRGKIYSPKNDVPYYIGSVLIKQQDIVTTPPPAIRYWLIELEERGGKLIQPFPAKLVSENTFRGLKLSLYETP